MILNQVKRCNYNRWDNTFIMFLLDVFAVVGVWLDGVVIDGVNGASNDNTITDV